MTVKEVDEGRGKGKGFVLDHCNVYGMVYSTLRVGDIAAVKDAGRRRTKPSFESIDIGMGGDNGKVNDESLEKHKKLSFVK